MPIYLEDDEMICHNCGWKGERSGCNKSYINKYEMVYNCPECGALLEVRNG